MGIINKNQNLIKDTALDPNHVCYWGSKKLNRKTIILKCQICGREEYRKIDRDKIPKGEV